MNRLYYKYSDYLKEKYGEKIYKIPVNIPVSCPNRDEFSGLGGCTFCGDEAAGFEALDSSMSVREQLQRNIKYIGEKYKANKFIAYFQNYTGTYMQPDKFEEYLKSAVENNIVEIAVSTRPDCISYRHLDILREISVKNNIEISVELGLQTCNYNTLMKINRGHTLAEFLDAVLMIKNYEFHICTHLILNLPWDSTEDSIECAKIMSAMDIDSIKIHSLAILKGTKMSEQFSRGEIEIITKEQYLERLISFLEHLNPDMAIQRFFSRIPEERTVFSNWGISWRKLNNELDEKMVYNDTYQGRKFDFLKGKNVKKFI